MLILSGTKVVLPRRPEGIIAPHQIDWNHWALRDMRGLFMGGPVKQPIFSPVNAGLGIVPFAQAGATITTRVADGQSVPVMQCNASGEYGVWFIGSVGPTGYWDSDSGKWMIATKLFRRSANGSNSFPLMFCFRRWGLAINNSDDDLSLYTTVGSGQYQDLDVNVDTNSRNTYGVSHDGSNARVFKGGVYQRQEAISNHNTSTDSTFVRFSWDGTSNYVEGDYEWGAFWKGTADDRVMEWSHDYLYEIFDLPPKRFYFDAAAGAGVSVTPDTATVTATGYAPTAANNTAVAVTPDTATVAATGYAPTAANNTAVSVTPGVGAVAATGYAPSVTVDSSVNAEPGVATVTATGFAPSPSIAVSVTPGVASVAVTGHAVTAGNNTSVSVTPGLATVAGTGYAPTISAGAAISVTPGLATVGITGYAPEAQTAVWTAADAASTTWTPATPASTTWSN